FRQKLLRVPLELDYPYWVEDERFDLEYHVRHVALPKPGDWRQFCIQASRIHARPLDLSRPLWEIYLVEGLDDFLDLPDNSFALLTKIHHSAVDLSGGAEITTLLHDTVAEAPPADPPEPWFPTSPPGSVSLLARALVHNVVQPFEMAGPLMRTFKRLGPVMLGAISDAFLHPERQPITRFNAEVSPHRVFESRRFLLEEFREIRALVDGATVNDVVLAVCGGALRRYLLAHDELPPSSLVGIAPISIRHADASGARSGVSMLRVPLGTDIVDPVERLRQLQAHTAGSDAVAHAVGARELTDLSKHAPARTLATTARLLSGAALGVGQHAPLANCTITNVPGPAIPLYLNGARMTYFSAIMPISDGMGLVFAVTSYDGRIIISPTSCREQIPDPEYFALCIRESFQEYLELAVRSAGRKRKASPRKQARHKARQKVGKKAKGTRGKGAARA
ncbi:MAG TPA: wax ester/triacylglycerol synthase family O-acyltransferase, partial [Rubrivivax sp.]|nr:wax ester/triacylglycerol synthase family O-acyltransferase [Rubrivivax sp.]